MSRLRMVEPFTNKDVVYIPAYPEEECPENWFFSVDMLTRCEPLFDHCEDNYDVEDVLIKAGVVGTDDTPDSETGEMVINFPNQEAGEKFITRLNAFLNLKYKQLARAFDLECGP